MTRAHARTFAYLLVGNHPIDPGVTAVHKNRHAAHRNAAPKGYVHALGEGNRQGVSINKVVKILYLSCVSPITKRARNAGGRRQAVYLAQLGFLHIGSSVDPSMSKTSKQLVGIT